MGIKSADDGIKFGKKPILKFFFAILVALIIIFLIFKITSPYRDPRFLSAKITDTFYQTLRRDFSFEKVYLSGRTLIFENVKLQERGSFSGGDFFEIKKLALKLKFVKLIKNSTLTGSVKLFEPTVIIKRNQNGGWNIEDLIFSFKNETSQFNFENMDYEVENGLVLLEDKQTPIDLKFSELKAKIKDFDMVRSDIFSNVSGSYKEQKINAVINVKNYSSKTDTNLHLTATDFKVNNSVVSYVDLDCRIKDKNKPLAERKIYLDLKLENVCFNKIPKKKDSDFWLVVPFKVSQALGGNRMPKTEDLKIEHISIGLNYKKPKWHISKMEFKSPEIYWNLNGVLDIFKKTADLGFKMQFGKDKLQINTSGSIKNPEIKPEMSDAIGREIMKNFKNLETFIDKVYFRE